MRNRWNSHNLYILKKHQFHDTHQMDFEILFQIWNTKSMALWEQESTIRFGIQSIWISGEFLLLSHSCLQKWLWSWFLIPVAMSDYIFEREYVEILQCVAARKFTKIIICKNEYINVHDFRHHSSFFRLKSWCEMKIQARLNNFTYSYYWKCAEAYFDISFCSK